MGNQNVKNNTNIEINELVKKDNNKDDIFTKKNKLNINNHKIIKNLIYNRHYCLYYSKTNTFEILWCGEAKCKVKKPI